MFDTAVELTDYIVGVNCYLGLDVVFYTGPVLLQDGCLGNARRYLLNLLFQELTGDPVFILHLAVVDVAFKVDSNLLQQQPLDLGQGFGAGGDLAVALSGLIMVLSDKCLVLSVAVYAGGEDEDCCQ